MADVLVGSKFAFLGLASTRKIESNRVGVTLFFGWLQDHNNGLIFFELSDFVSLLFVLFAIETICLNDL